MDDATGRTTTMTVQVRPGDCDPAGIVGLTRYQRWIEAASVHSFSTCMPATQLLEQHVRFVRSARDGDRLLIRTHTEERPHGELLQTHMITRDDELIGECSETRRRCRADPQSLGA